MSDESELAKNPASKILAAQEKIMFGKPAESKPVRAEIIVPGKNKAYSTAKKGGVAAKPVQKIPPRKAKIRKKPAKEKIKKKKLSPAQQSQALAESVVLSFTYKLIDEARAKGGYLSVSDLKELNQGFQEKTAELKVAFEKTFEDYITDHERKTWLNSRMRPFDRMIVKTFSHLLEDDTLKIRRSDHVSRRMLPGFFMALNLMLGSDHRESYQGKCRAIVKLVSGSNNRNFNWDDIYENEDARAICFDALIEIARHFSNFDKRREWFIDLVNSHIPTTDPTSNDDENIWVFSPEGFDEFFKALMSELRIAVSMDAGRSLITRRHDAETTVELVKLMKKLSPAKKA